MRLSLLGIAVGAVADIVGTAIFTLPVVALALMHSGAVAGSNGSPAGLFEHQPLLHAISVLIGCACSVLGGYVAASIAKHDDVLNGACSSVLCLASGIFELAVPGVGHEPTWLVLATLPLSLALAAAGGYLRLRQRGGRVAPALS